MSYRVPGLVITCYARVHHACHSHKRSRTQLHYDMVAHIISELPKEVNVTSQASGAAPDDGATAGAGLPFRNETVTI